MMPAPKTPKKTPIPQLRTTPTTSKTSTQPSKTKNKTKVITQSAENDTHRKCLLKHKFYVVYTQHAS